MEIKLAEVSPNPLSFCLSDKINKKTLTLKNITDKYILYKFLINTRGILLAKPPTSFIPPSQIISIDVYLLNNSLPLEEYMKTKLLIMFIESDEEIKSMEEAKKKFQILKNENNDKQEILVNLIINSEEKLLKNENDDIQEFITNLIINSKEKVENKEENEVNKNEKITYINYEQLRNELDEKNKEITKNIEIYRKKLENLVSQENKLNNSMSDKGKRKKYYNIDNLLFIFIILIGLIIGANCSCGYNKLFKKK